MRAEGIAARLNERPSAYRFDIRSFALIKEQTLREHIEKVGISVYP